MDLRKHIRATKANLERELALAIHRRDKTLDELIELKVDLRDVERQIAALDAAEALNQQSRKTEQKSHEN